MALTLDDEIKAINDKVHVKINVTGIGDEDTLALRMVLYRLADIVNEFNDNGIRVEYSDDDKCNTNKLLKLKKSKGWKSR